ncbi:MAG TPA: molybdopterin-dependent oxidoreductase [Thermoanaerobaculia bacterium]|nr:molybdopterin-dependent oxidoreductase [Thermoanaerobaculia bacterium]
MTRTVFRACNLCEAICGLELEIDGPRIVSIRGDADDPFSRGHLCPKGVALMDIHDDPARLRRPMVREENAWRETSWDEAIEHAAEGLARVQQRGGNDAVGVYLGNPTVHNSGTLLNLPLLARVLSSRNVFSATSVDQLPHQLISYWMYGHQFLIPIPDIDRTDYFLILGANPVVSNGSIMTVPDVTRRLAAIRARGGKIVVIDPRRTETARVADEHHFIRPATDAALLMALLNTLREEGLMRIARPEKLRGLDEALAAIAHMTAERAEEITGIDAQTMRRLARELARAPHAVVYGRVGTTLQSFGTLNQWLIQLLNLVTGNLDREGGALVTTPLIPLNRRGSFGRWTSRVRGLPESNGELPVATFAEEILTEGDGQIRGVVTIAGNPILSTPDGRQLDRALASLDFMVSIDIYRNETTQHANVILPPASSLQHDHYDTVFNALAVRNVARFNEAIWPRAEDERYDWEIIGALTERLAAKLGRETKRAHSTAQIVAAAVGEKFDELRKAPHGLDLGALQPSLYERVETIDCAPPLVLADVARFSPVRNDEFLLIGRRDLRSNNSWMHRSHRLTKGARRDQLFMHPDDVTRLGLEDGQRIVIRANVGSVQTIVKSTDAVMRGVVCLPHGHAHVSYNDLADAREIDAVSGNAALNGVRVTIAAAR